MPAKPSCGILALLKLLDRYILRELLPPALVGLLLCTFVLLMNQILLLAELFIQKGVPFGVAAEVLLLLVPSILAFAVPMSVLMGILGGLGRLSTDSELTALQTLGIGFPRLLKPALVFALGGWLIASGLALFLAPRANDRWVRTMTRSVLGRTELRIKALEFNESIPDTVLYIRNIRGDKTWEDVFVFVNRDPLEPRVILARRGRINLYPGQKRATLELFDGAVHSGPVSSPGEYRITSFRRLEEEIDVASLFSTISSEKRVREKDIRELVRDARVLREEVAALAAEGLDLPDERLALSPYRQKSRELRSHRVEIHKKFALPFTCLIFVLIGLPLGALAGKGGRTSGFTVSLGIILLYYVLITTGEKLAVDGKVSAFLGMWGPDLLLAGAGLALWSVALRGPWPPARRHVAGSVRSERKETRSGPPPPLQPRRLVRYPFRFPGIIDRYVARKYLAIFALVFLTLVAVSSLAMFFERLDDLYRHDKPIGLLLRHIWFRLPETVFFILPVTALTASLLGLGFLAKFNEVTAMKAAGIGLHRLAVPVVALALAVGAAAFLIQDRLMPAANIRAEETWGRIMDLPPRSYSFLNRHWVLGRQKDRIYHYEVFDVPSSTFRRLSVFDLDPAGWTLARRIYGDRAALEETRLVLRDGWLRDFKGDAMRSFVAGDAWEMDIEEPKSYFLREWKEPSQMTYGELRAYTEEVREMGFGTDRLRIDLGTRLAFPLVGLIMSLVAIPFALSLGRKGILAGIGLSVVIAAVYWGAVAVFRSLGYAGFLPSFLAVWGPHLVFGLSGAYALLRLRS